MTNAGLAAGATYQWIVKPWRAGKFKSGAEGRKLALIKAGLAGTFDDVVNQVKDAGKNAGAEVTDKVPSASQLTS